MEDIRAKKRTHNTRSSGDFDHYSVCCFGIVKGGVKGSLYRVSHMFDWIQSVRR
jgi:hypothetical protein